MRKLLMMLFCVLTYHAYTQTSSPYAKFGSIEIKDLQNKFYAIDSNAAAVVLCDIGKSAIEGNSKGWFSVSFKRHRVVHILKTNGYGEADVEIPLYSHGEDEETLEKLKAYTYNLENGKVVETKLEKSAIFKEKRSANLEIRKFTFPNVKEGSIIEFEYEVLSDYISNLDPWNFQGASPVLWSEYTLSVPQFFSYAFLSHGYHRMHVNERKDRTSQFVVLTNAMSSSATDRTSINAGVTDFRWAMINLPEIKKENYASSLKNHIASLEFQLASQNDPLMPRTYRSSWTELTKSLLEAEYFGAKLEKENNWVGADENPLIKDAATETEKAKRIYEYVRDNFICTSHNTIYASQTLKNVLKTRKGNVAEINLLLTVMLRYAGLKADPVLLSTSDHGYALEYYPMITSFNYVITSLVCDNKEMVLDGSHARLGFGALLPECYNGHARVVNESARPIYLVGDSLKEKKFTSFLLSADEKGGWIAGVNQTPGYYESYHLRNKILESGKDEFIKSLTKDFTFTVKMKDSKIDSLSRFDYPLTLQYEFDVEPAGEEILYINPLFGEGYNKNPFESTQRHYPVELPYTIDETYVLTMEVPKGYEVDELPKQILAKMDQDGSAYFEYRITHSGSMISMRTIVRFNKTIFLPDEYENLRAFFNLIVSKHAEQIVLRKKK